MRVFVGLSGGVDSSVAAHMLQREGHEVTGVFIRTWQPAHIACTQADDERSAFAAAAHLRIPFLTLDLADVYYGEVGQRFIEGYARGETPNPDVLCNREVKFGAFLRFARERGADAVATGHYARIVGEGAQRQLMRGVDAEKDQSYFLALVPHELLAFIRFPLDGLHKKDVRAIAAASGLPTASRKDSQGICFLGAVDLREFLSPYIALSEGAVLNASGAAIGTHHGAALYTLGERHGFTAQGQHAPLYVGAIDVRANTITVMEKDALPTMRELHLRDVSLHGPIDGPLVAQVRYHGAKLHATVSRTDGAYVVHMKEPVLVAPGQAVALYRGDALVLGGILTDPR